MAGWPLVRRLHLAMQLSRQEVRLYRRLAAILLLTTAFIPYVKMRPVGFSSAVSAGGALGGARDFTAESKPLLDRSIEDGKGAREDRFGVGARQGSSMVPGVPLSKGVLRVAAAVAAASAWMFVSSFLILANKYIMVDLKFKYPMAVSLMGMAMSGILAFVCCRVLKVVEMNAVVRFRFWATKILPIGFFMALTLWTGNEVYLYLTVAFIQMLKAFTPVVTMICLFVARLEDPTRSMILSVLLTAAGTAVAVRGEMNLSIVGLVLMFSSETCESIRLVMTQFLLVGLKFHPIEGLMYLAPACCVWLGLGCLLVEVPTMLRNSSLDIMFEHKALFLAAAVMGFAVNTLAYTTIKLASSLTLKVLGTVKNTLLVVFGVLFLGEVVTGLQGLGYAVSLTGFAWYNWIKMTQIATTGAGAGAGAAPGAVGAGSKT